MVNTQISVPTKATYVAPAETMVVAPTRATVVASAIAAPIAVVATAEPIVPNIGAGLSDEKLFELCRQYGKNALLWRQKFLGLLPEVSRRRLYEKRGFSSIFEFGFKLAGVSENQIRKVLNLEIRFRDKRILHRMLVNGNVSVNKLARIASIATIENQGDLARQVEILPSRALETLARDERILKAELVKSNLQNVHVHTQTPQIGLFGKSDAELNLSEEVTKKLLELQRRGIDINELLTEFLDRREEEIEEEKEEIAKELEAKTAGAVVGTVTVARPRYVRVKIKKLMKKEYGTKCAAPTCNKLAVPLHHTLHFAISQNHDPRYLVPLCKEHHLIAHSIDRKLFEKRREALM